MTHQNYKVNVTNDDGDVIARVLYTSNLDYWDGHNWTNGGVGYHKGITKLKDGRYVLICGTQWEGSRDTATVVSPKEALNEIFHSGNVELLEDPRFSDLKALADETLSEEDEGHLEQQLE